jgi:hypothetical protein
MSSQQAYREYMNFLKGTVKEYESKMTSSISIVVLAIIAIFLFEENNTIIYGCIAVISYCSTEFMLSLYRTRQWQQILENAPKEVEQDIEEFR